MGHLEFTIHNVSLAVMRRLIEAYELPVGSFDTDGEINKVKNFSPYITLPSLTPLPTAPQDVGPLLVSRLISEDFCPEEDYEDSATSYPLMESVYALQCPSSSPWGAPFIAVRSCHTFSRSTQRLTVRLHIYFSRLLFELISDPAIKHIIENLKGSPGRRRRSSLLYLSAADIGLLFEP
jgi:hypothetical protein